MPFFRRHHVLMKLLPSIPLSPSFRFFSRFKVDYWRCQWPWGPKYRTMEVRLGCTVVEYSLS